MPGGAGFLPSTVVVQIKQTRASKSAFFSVGVFVALGEACSALKTNTSAATTTRIRTRDNDKDNNNKGQKNLRHCRLMRQLLNHIVTYIILKDNEWDSISRINAHTWESKKARMRISLESNQQKSTIPDTKSGKRKTRTYMNNQSNLALSSSMAWTYLKCGLHEKRPLKDLTFPKGVISGGDLLSKCQDDQR